MLIKKQELTICTAVGGNNANQCIIINLRKTLRLTFHSFNFISATWHVTACVTWTPPVAPMNDHDTKL